MKRLIAILLMVGVSAPAFAGDLSESINAEVMKAAQASASSKASDNQYLWPSVALMGGGALISLYGFLHTTGANINVGTNATGTNSSISVNTTHNTGLGIAGLAVVGLGGYLLWKGAQKHSPSISFGRGSVKVQKSFSF
jgi:hypothetical protein